jgi:hypothetical protein
VGFDLLRVSKLGCNLIIVLIVRILFMVPIYLHSYTCFMNLVSLLNSLLNLGIFHCMGLEKLNYVA